MSPRSRIFERILNGITLLAALGVLVVVAQRFRGTGFPPQGEAHGPEKGTAVKLSGIDWDSNGQTLLMALSTNCHYCSESAGFYRTLARAADSMHATHLVALFPESLSESRNYLESKQIGISDVRQERLGSIGVRATPTLVLVDSTGHVQASWMGKLSTDGQRDVLAHLGTVLPQRYDFAAVKKADGSVGLSAPVTGSELRSLLASEKNIELVDVRTREEFSVAHIEAAINIPMDEIASRVPHEIARDSRLVIYCHFCPPCEADASNRGVMSKCVMAATLFREVGHEGVSFVADDLANIRRAGVLVLGDPAKLENEAGTAR